jgi:hypothetical protein
MSSMISAEERLLRNIHPNDIDNGRINSSCFDPSVSHGFKLSLDREALCRPEASFIRHTSSGLASVGVYGVQCSDFRVQSIPCFSDPLSSNNAHALADYSAFGSSARKKKARIIADIARNGGPLYSPP